MSDAPDTVLFHEAQRFRDPFLWAAIVGVTAVVTGTIAWMITRQVVQGRPFGPEALSNSALLTMGIVVAAMNLFYVLRYAVSVLQTEVTHGGLFVRYWPRQRKVRQIDLSGVTQVRPVAYQPYLHYGGRGWKRQRRATAYTVGGRRGVRLDYGNGAHVLLGTGDAEGLAAAIEAALARARGGKDESA